MSSKKKKNPQSPVSSPKNEQAQNDTAQSVSQTKNAPKETDKEEKSSVSEPENIQEKNIDEENIPVQSLSEMLAFAREAEAESEAEEVRENIAKNEPEQESKSSVHENKPSPVPEKLVKQPSGPPITAEEAAARAESEDALDRDLENARRKKLKEEAYLKHQREMEAKKEAERIARAEQAKQRQINAAEMAKKAEQVKAAAQAQQPVKITETKSAPKKQGSAVKSFNRTLASMAAVKGIAVAVVAALLLYGGAFIYVDSQNEKFYSELETKLNGQSKLVTDSSVEYTLSGASQLSLDEKTEQGLELYLADSDKDGLSDYYEINVSDTDPKNPDSDGDGLYDGRELRAGLDPLNPSTDGVSPDGEVIRDTTVASDIVSAEIKGQQKTAYSMISKLNNNSIQGIPGLACPAYEFYTDKPFDSCNIIFTYSDKTIAEKALSESALSVFRFDSDKLIFEKLTSTLNTEANTVSAQISEGGIYAVCDTGILMQKGKTNVFFLIDNSGSMYPEELCANSEENDVEFKRLDFAVNLMDMLGVDASYGAGEFSGSYANISPISGDAESVKQKINAIRDKNQVFSGTEIAGAVSAAVKEFGRVSGADRNYIILLTDGMPSVYNSANDTAAIAAAKAANITVFTIGLGKYIDSEYLYNIAEQTNGQFFQASNADALENIYEKIQNFMSYNQVTFEEDSEAKGYIVADSGFNVLKDGIGYSNFRADFAPYGADPGIAGLIRDYYDGSLSLSQEGFTTADGRDIPGYDISSVAGFADGKADLTSVELEVLRSYNEYLSRADKWNYRSVRGGTLQFTSDTRDFIDSSNLKVITADFEFETPDESGFMKFLRTITFNRIKPFTSYECVLIDSQVLDGDDYSIMNMLRWYCAVPVSSDKCEILDFGYEGDAAFDVLLSELTTGTPAVIIYGGSAMNAVRVIRDADNPDKFVIDAYDSNSPERSTRINLERTPVYDGDTVPYYQYTASRGSVSESLTIVVEK